MPYHAHISLTESDYYGQKRYTGTIQADIPLCFISLVSDTSGIWYRKSEKTPRTVYELDILFHHLTKKLNRQVMVRIDHTSNFSGQWHSDGTLLHTECSMQTEVPMTLFTEDGGNGKIQVYAFAAVDVEMRRCGIWRVKKRRVESIQFSYPSILLTTRHGHIRIPAPTDADR